MRVAVSSALKRLLRVRGLEEEQHRTALESAMGELHRLEAALQECAARELRGRSLVGAAALTHEPVDRQAGLVEVETARRSGRVLAARRRATEQEAARRRAEFLEKRVERRQAEALIDDAQARDAAVEGHRAQQSLDDWHAGRRRKPEGMGGGEAAPRRQLEEKDEEIVSRGAGVAPDPGNPTQF